MWILTLIALSSMFFVGAIFFIECKIVEDLPQTNSFRRWWRRNIIDKEPEL